MDSTRDPHYTCTAPPFSVPYNRRARAVTPAQEMLYKNKTGYALEEGTSLEKSLDFAAFDLQSRSRKEAFPSQGMILMQIHPDRTASF